MSIRAPDQGAGTLRFEEPSARRRLGCCHQFGNVFLHEAGVEVVGGEVWMSEYRLQKRKVVRHALDSKLAQRALRLAQGSGEIRRA